MVLLLTGTVYSFYPVPFVKLFRIEFINDHKYKISDSSMSAQFHASFPDSFDPVIIFTLVTAFIARGTTWLALGVQQEEK